MSPLSRLAVLALCAVGLKADSSLAPTLQWVQTLGGSGANQVNAAAADSHGNLYITGSTSSPDFPVTSAAQPNPSGSPLYRIDTATGASQKLYPPGLLAPTSLAVDPRNPKTLCAAALVAYKPNLKDFKMPPQVGVRLVLGTVDPSNPDNSAIISQPGLVLNVKQ